MLTQYMHWYEPGATVLSCFLLWHTWRTAVPLLDLCPWLCAGYIQSSRLATGPPCPSHSRKHTWKLVSARDIILRINLPLWSIIIFNNQSKWFLGRFGVRPSLSGYCSENPCPGRKGTSNEAVDNELKLLGVRGGGLFSSWMCKMCWIEETSQVETWVFWDSTFLMS